MSESCFLTASTRRHNAVKQLAIRQTDDLIADIGFEIIEIENDGIERCAQGAIHPKITAIFLASNLQG